MLLRLIIMRHGEAEVARSGLNESDHARKLTANGFMQSRALGRKLTAAGWIPRCGIASDSARTRETASGLESSIGPGTFAWRYSKRLYLTGMHAVVEELEGVDAQICPTVIVLGHNPGFSEAATLLTGEAISLGTADAALVTIDASSWPAALVATCGWKLESLVSPS